MKVNKVLLFMKLHYFFVFAGVAPVLPFIPPYANSNLQISYIGIGLIYTILPIMGLLSKSLSGMLADWLSAHRVVFLTSLVVCALGYSSVYFTSPMPMVPNPDPAYLKLDCSYPSSYLRYHISEKKCGAKDFIDGNKNDNASIAICEVTCPTSPSKVGAICKYWNISASQCEATLLKFSAYSFLAHAEQTETDTFFPIHNLSYIGIPVEHPTCTKHLLLNCTAICDNSKLMDFFGAPLKKQLSDYTDILSHYQFWTFLLCIVIAWCGLAILVVMSDTLCFQLLGSEGGSYGKQRLFGSLGWSLSAMLTGFLIDFNSGDSLFKDYTPAFILCLSIMFIDLIIASRLKFVPQQRCESQASSVVRLLIEPKIGTFILCCIVAGISTNLLWTFQLILVKKVTYEWNCHFEHLKLLQGLIMGIQSFGEIPFFFLSGAFIKKLGHLYCMSLVLASFGVRYILYYFVSNPWYFLPIELLNGLTFGIFYSTMTSYASIIALPGTQATIQGLFGASFEGLGMAIGAFAGGALFSAAGESETFLYAGIFNLGIAALYTIYHMVMTHSRSPYELANTVPVDGDKIPNSDSLRPVVENEVLEE